MRLIGHVPNEAHATTFSDFLLVQGIANEIESDKQGWAVWVHSEDEWTRARQMLDTFLLNPRDPQYAAKAGEAPRVRERIKDENEEAESRVYNRRAVFRATMPYGVGPLTTVIVFLCVAIAVLAWTGHKERIFQELLLTRVDATETGVQWQTGLKEIRAWEVWRLLTPAFVHIDVLHLLFNMLWLLDLGSMVEGRQGTGRFGLKLIVFGVLSNLGQFLLTGPWFNGFSGVNYGLFGYIWVRGRMDPRSGLYLHPHTVAMMIIWYFLCLFGVISNVANMGHAVGMGLGIVWGFLASLPASRRRSVED